MSMLNKITDPIAEIKLGIISEWALRFCLSWVMFENGQPKFNKLLEAPNEPLSFITKMDFFSNFPVISSWLITISELVLIPLFIILGGLKFIGPTANALSTLGGILATLVMIIIIWGFHFPVLNDSISDIHLQIMLLAMSMYFLFRHE